MTELDLLIARSQRNISNSTLAIIAVVVLSLLFMPIVTSAKIDPTVEKLLYVILGGIVSNLASQNQFWFGRPRSAGVPDPAAVAAGPINNVEKMTIGAPPVAAKDEKEQSKENP